MTPETPFESKAAPAWRRPVLLALMALWALTAAPAAAEVAYGTGDDAAPPAARSHGRGLKFKPAETYRSFERTSATRGLALPPAADLSAFFPPPKDQGDQSSCVGWSVGYGLRSYYANRARGQSGGAAPVLLSPSFVYNQIAEPGVCDGGSNISDALDLLRDVGTVPLNRFPYRDSDCSRRPSLDIKREAANWRIRGWTTVDLRNPATVKEQLAKGNPVVIGMYVNDDFVALAGPAVFRDTAKDGDGHAMVVVGYDDRKRAFRIFNSWGPEWGENGLGWVSYDSFKARVDEAYVASVADLPPIDTSAPPAPAPKIAPPPEPEPAPEPAPRHRADPDPAPAPSHKYRVDPPPEPEPASAEVPSELKPKGRDAFETYLAAAGHKAFAVARDGSFGWRSGRADPSTAGEEAVAACERHTEYGCTIVNLDGRAMGGRRSGPVEIPAIKGRSDDQ